MKQTWGIRAIILDLDHTLIEGDLEAGYIEERPFLDYFLGYLLDRWPVGLWTHGSESWVNLVSANTSLGKYRHRLAFEMTWKDRNEIIEGHTVWPYKKLSKVFKKKGLKRLGFTREHTIFVEDTVKNGAFNYGNMIEISPWEKFGSGSYNDTELVSLAAFLSDLDVYSKSMGLPVRLLEKREWKGPIGHIVATVASHHRQFTS